jgi:ABC-type nitrate/sulfonate/bicarbonate transport system ATPase subunit
MLFATVSSRRRLGRGLSVTELLSIKRLRKGYARGEEWTAVLADVSFELLRGEIVAIVGGRLEGKTTLLKIAAGVERPDDGTVLLAGRPLAELADRPRAVRWVDRDGPGLEARVAEVVGWPLAAGGRRRRRAEWAAVQMLDRVGGGDCAGGRWGELSNWQRVLVGLARGFIGSPQLVVVDDLLDALGEPATERASDLMRSLVETAESRCGVLMSASSTESAMLADRVLTITGKGSLKQLSSRLTDAGEVVPFRKSAKGDAS